MVMCLCMFNHAEVVKQTQHAIKFRAYHPDQERETNGSHKEFPIHQREELSQTHPISRKICLISVLTFMRGCRWPQLTGTPSASKLYGLNFFVSQEPLQGTEGRTRVTLAGQGSHWQDKGRHWRDKGRTKGSCVPLDHLWRQVSFQFAELNREFGPFSYIVIFNHTVK